MSQKYAIEKPQSNSANQNSGEELDAWGFPSIARDIALRFNSEVIEPARLFITKRDEARKKLNEKISAELKELERVHEQQSKALDARLGDIRSSTNSTREKAKGHLQGQKLSTPDIKSTDANKSKEITGDDRTLEKSIQDLIGKAKQLSLSAANDCETDILKQSRPPNAGFDFDGGAGCAVTVLALIAWFAVGKATESGEIGFLSGLAVFILIMVLRNTVPTSAMENGWIRLSNSIVKINTDLERALALFIELQRRALAELKKKHDDELSLFRKAEQADLESMTAKLKVVVEDVKTKSQTLVQNADWACIPWQDNRWSEWEPPSSPSFCAGFGNEKPTVPDIARELPSLPLDVALPAFFPFSESKGVMMISEGSPKDGIAKAVEGFVLRLLAVIPPGKARFTFIDPVGLGNSVAGLMSLADHDETLVNSRAWSEPRACY